MTHIYNNDKYKDYKMNYIKIIDFDKSNLSNNLLVFILIFTFTLKLTLNMIIKKLFKIVHKKWIISLAPKTVSNYGNLF